MAKKTPVSDYDVFISYGHSVDKEIAVAVQKGLRQFGRKWWRLWALRVFRDETNLAATPDLWNDIRRALDRSRCFVLLASRRSAQSTWVKREIHHWLSRRERQSFLIILTDGDVAWDPAHSIWDWNRTTALPERLDAPTLPDPPVRLDSLMIPTQIAGDPQARVGAEPLWIDLRWARDSKDLHLRNGRFYEQIRSLSARIHGVEPDYWGTEDVRRHATTMRTAWGAMFAILLLLATASIMALLFDRARDTAITERNRAVVLLERATGIELARRAGAQLAERQDVEAGRMLLHARALLGPAPTPLELSVVDDVARKVFGTFAAIDRTQIAVAKAWGTEASAVALLPDGAVVAAADDGALVLLRGGIAVKLDTGHAGAVIGIAVTDAGDWGVSVERDGQLRRWPTDGSRAGRPTGALPSSESATDLVLTDDGAVAWVSTSTRGHLWRCVLASAGCTPAIEAVGSIRDLDVSHAGVVAAVDMDGRLLVVDTRATPPSVRVAEVAPKVVLNAVAFSHDGGRIAVGGDSGTLVILDANDLSVAARMASPGERVWSLAFHPTMPLLLSGDFDTRLRAWDLREHDRPALDVDASVLGLRRLVCRITKVGPRCAGAAVEGSVPVWDVRWPAAAPRLVAKHADVVEGLSVHAVNGSIASGASDGRLWVTGAAPWSSSDVWSSSARIRDVAWLGDHLIVAGEGPALAMHAGPKRVRSFLPDRRQADSLALVSAEQAVFVVVDEGQPLLVPLDGGDPTTFTKRVATMTGMVWNREFNSLVAVSIDDGTVWAWSRQYPEADPNVLFTDGMPLVRAVQRGDMIVTAGHSRRVHVFHLADGQHRSFLASHATTVSAVALLGDGALVTADTDGTILVHNALEPNQVRARWVSDRGAVSRLAVSHDQQHVLSAHADGSVLEWPLLDDVLHIACERINTDVDEAVWSGWGIEGVRPGTPCTRRSETIR